MRLSSEIVDTTSMWTIIVDRNVSPDCNSNSVNLLVADG